MPSSSHERLQQLGADNGSGRVRINLRKNIVSGEKIAYVKIQISRRPIAKDARRDYLSDMLIGLTGYCHHPNG